MKLIKNFIFHFFYLTFLLLFLNLNAFAIPIEHVRPEVYVMAPLTIGDFRNLFIDINLDSEWVKFRNHLSQIKKAGVTGVSVDVWWGLVEGERPNWLYTTSCLCLEPISK